MIRTLLPAILISLFAPAYSQEQVPPKDTTSTQHVGEVFIPVDKMPEFPGGMAKFYSYLNREFKCSPKNQGTDKKIFIEFIVDSTGYVRKGAVNLKQGNLGQVCKDRIISVLENSPRWVPGRVTVMNKDVPVRFVLPLNLK